MTERELREIKRRFRPEKSNIPRIVGCLVNGNKQIVSKINQSIGVSESDVSEGKLCNRGEGCNRTVGISSVHGV